MSGGAEVWAGFSKDLAASQDARKASIEQRGLAVVTTSGTLVSLLFALVALISKANDFKLPTQARGPTGVGLLLFTLAAAGGLVCNFPLWTYSNAKRGAIVKVINSNSKKLSEDQSQAVVADFYSRLYVKASKSNRIKVWVLFGAMVLEVLAVLAIAIAVAEVLKHS